MALSTLKQACQLSRLAGSLRPAIYRSSRGFAAEPAQEESDHITLEVNPFKGHKVEPPGNVVETNKDELFDMYKTMFLMRRMELTADQLYKQKLARGFLHLADGQEGVPVGMEAALDFDDSMIQSYRDHCTYVGRGGTMKKVFAELMGRVDGPARGLGGSMHLYHREHNFFGGVGIVGEQIPVGTGLGFAHQYRDDGHVAFTIYGDGAANQGQIFEAFNMAAIWNLPVVYVVENNHYGMGTADSRASKSPQYYTRGDYVPGLWVDGMDCLAVKQACLFAKKHALEKGPILLEMDTYRYHGHSISDPGSTYRTRDEVSGIRRARDPIEHVKQIIIEHGWADGNELKRMEKELKAQVNAELEEAKKSPFPPEEDFYNNIYVDGLGAKLRPIEVGMDKIQLPKGPRGPSADASTH